MRVAIIGAGLSGLACAHELELHGIYPVIFEERYRSGELFPHVAGFLQLMNRPVRNQIKYLKKKYNLPITPLNPLERVIMHTPNMTRNIKGKLGYLFHRGQDENSVESQLQRLVQTPIFFNYRADYSVLARQYDYVVVANGAADVARTLGCWQDIIKTWVRGAVILGEFDPKSLVMWLNTKLFRSSYAYMTAFNERRASLVQIVTDSNPDEIELYWRRFWEVHGFKYKIVENFSLQHVSGYVYPHQVGNILLVGNAGGFLEPFLGFGMMAALRSGVLAARSIIKGESYEKNVMDLKEQILNALAIRRAINNLDNEAMQLVTALATAPGVKQLNYHTNIDVLKYGAKGLGLLESINKLLRR